MKALLRRRFPEERYLGFELELNQSWPLRDGKSWQRLQLMIRDSLQKTLGGCQPIRPPVPE
ncbi:MAG: hypothetical protein ACSLFC_10685 [Desulfuromonadales bacterium]